MKEILLQYARYNIWANDRIIEALMKLDEASLDKEILSSFPTIRGTVLHTWSAENTWLQRLQLVAQPEWVQATFKGTFSEACAGWQKASASLEQYTAQLANDDSVKTALLYKDLRENEHNTPIHQVLHHVFNHSTYHRGQLVTMLRQAGVTEIPGTDFIGYVRMMK